MAKILEEQWQPFLVPKKQSELRVEDVPVTLQLIETNSVLLYSMYPQPLHTALALRPTTIALRQGGAGRWPVGWDWVSGLGA